MRLPAHTLSDYLTNGAFRIVRGCTGHRTVDVVTTIIDHIKHVTMHVYEATYTRPPYSNVWYEGTGCTLPDILCTLYMCIHWLY